MGTVIGMYAAFTGGTNNGIASIDVPRDGRIIGVQWAVRGDLDADNDVCTLELSFGSTGQLTTNDTRSRISVVTLGNYVLLTSGGGFGVANVHHPLPLIEVGMGERIFLHELSTAGITGAVWAQLNFDFDLDKTPARRR